MRSPGRLIFAEMTGGRLLCRDADGRLLAIPPRPPRRAVLCRRDYELYVLPRAAHVADSREKAGESPEAEVRSLCPSSVEGMEIDSRPRAAGACEHVVLVMKRETLSSYRRYLGSARLTLLSDLLQAGVPGLDDASVLHWTPGYLELLSFQRGTLADSLLVVPKGESRGRDDALARAARLLTTTFRLSQPEDKVYLLATSDQLPLIAERLALLLGNGGPGDGGPSIDARARGIRIGVIATESLSAARGTRDWFRRPTALRRCFPSVAATAFALLALCGAAVGTLFLRAETLEKEADRYRLEHGRAHEATTRPSSVELEVRGLSDELSRLRSLRPAGMYELLCELKAALGREVLIREITFSQGSFDFRALGPDALAALHSLEDSGRLRNLTLVEALPGDDEEMIFRIRGSYR